jgi:hypothetical protein
MGKGAQIMSLLGKVFGKTPSAKDIRLHLKELEREQRKKRRDLEVMAQTKQQKVQEAVEAKRSGKQELLRDIFRETRQVEIDWGHINSDLRRLSLTKTALGSILRRVEMLERGKDRKGLQKLITRFNRSSIQQTIDNAAVDDDTFNEMLEEILGEEETSAPQGRTTEDPGFAEFDRTITAMARAEDAGVTEPPVTKKTAFVRSAALRKARMLSDDDAELEKEIREMEQEVEELNKEIEEMKRQVAELRTIAADLEAQADGKDEEVKAMQAECEALIAEGEANIAQITLLKKMMSDMLELIKALRDEASEDTSKADQLDSQVAAKERELASKENELAALRAQLA